MKKFLYIMCITISALAITTAKASQETEEQTLSKSTEQTEPQSEKYICSRDNQSDSVFTDVYNTKRECRQYCKGIGTVCEPTGKKNIIDIWNVAD